MSCCILSFSSRKNGNCEQIGTYLQSMMPDAKFYRFSDFSVVPCGNCQYECKEVSGGCVHQDMEMTLLEAIVESDHTYFIVPNYCDYPCANFFIFNERSLCYFRADPNRLDRYEAVPKKTIVISNTNEVNFVTALQYHGIKEKDILFLSSHAYNKDSMSNDLLDVMQVKEKIWEFVHKKEG